CSSILPRWASSGSSPIPLNLAPDGRVLLFSTAVAVVTGILFGLAPALQGSRIDPMHALKATSRGLSGSGGGGGGSFKQSLVAFQVALCVVLLVGAGLFLQTLRNFLTLDPGFDRDHIFTLCLYTHMAGYKVEQLPSCHKKLIDHVNA